MRIVMSMNGSTNSFSGKTDYCYYWKGVKNILLKYFVTLIHIGFITPGPTLTPPGVDGAAEHHFFLSFLFFLFLQHEQFSLDLNSWLPHAMSGRLEHFVPYSRVCGYLDAMSSPLILNDPL